MRGSRTTYRLHAWLRTPWGWTCLLAGLLSAVHATFIALYPLGIGTDYPNHLARTHIEGHLWQDPDLRQFYEVTFGLVSDLSMDLLVPWLSHLIGTYAAGAVAIFAAATILPVAALRLRRVLELNDDPWLGLLAFVGAFNAALGWGFVNFALTAGLAVFAFSAWVRRRPGIRRTALFAPIGVLLCLNHALGFLLFGYLVLFWELGRFRAAARGSPGHFVRSLVLWDGLAMLPGLMLLLVAALSSPDLDKSAFAFGWLARLITVPSATLFDIADPRWIDVLPVGLLVVLLYVGFRERVPRIVEPMRPVVFAVGLLVLMMPSVAFGIGVLSIRYAACLLALLAASTEIRPDGPKVRRWVGGLLTVLLAVQLVNVQTTLKRIDSHMDQLLIQLENINRGQRIFPVLNGEVSVNLLHSLSSAISYAVIERSAYIPMLFTNTSPVDVKPALRSVHRPQFIMTSQPPHQRLRELATRDLPVPTHGFWSTRFHWGWPRTFDYVVYLDPAGKTEFDLPCLQRVSGNAWIVVYAVALTRPDCPASWRNGSGAPDLSKQRLPQLDSDAVSATSNLDFARSCLMPSGSRREPFA